MAQREPRAMPEDGGRVRLVYYIMPSHAARRHVQPEGGVMVGDTGLEPVTFCV